MVGKRTREHQKPVIFSADGADLYGYNLDPDLKLPLAAFIRVIRGKK
jgi:hypothetical protein